MRKINLTIVFLLAVFIMSVFGQIPKTISYQAVLTDDSGTVVPDGSFQITFNFYDVNTGGTSIWTETQSLDLVDGILDVILGSVNPIDLAFDKQYWLGISIDGGTELQPRTELTSSAYSFSSLSVLGNSNVFPSEGTVGIGTTSPDPNSKLDVAGGIKTNGTLKLVSKTNPLSQTLQMFSNDSQHQRIVASDELTIGFESRLHFKGLTGTRMTIDTGGNVGIGTTTPAHRLDVAGTTQTLGFKLPTGASSGFVLTSDASGTGTWQPAANSDNNTSWSLNGNSGTNPDSNFVGTIDNIPLVFRVFGRQALRLESSADDFVNVIGGGATNLATNGAGGVSIGGGGSSISPNIVTDHYGTIGGGLDNQAGDGDTDLFSAQIATVGGGLNNKASGELSTIGGGTRNVASGLLATVSGGSVNGATGKHSTVPGGLFNFARGNYSFAAGRKAEANHTGAFVWSDSSGGVFGSSADSQFLIRAAGGVGIGTNFPTEMLSVAGTIESRTGGFKFPDGTLQTTAAVGGGSNGDNHSLDAADGNPIDAVFVDNNGNVGIGTTSPNVALEIHTTFSEANLFGLGDSSSKYYFRFASGSSIYLTTQLNGSDNIMTWKSDGNVGIGTIFPNSKLEVAGTIHSTTGGLKFPDGTLQTTAAVGGGGDGHSLDAADGDPVDAVFVDNDGNVGIGTTDPTHTLDVAGSLGIDDFIFHNDNFGTHILFSNDNMVLEAGTDPMLQLFNPPNFQSAAIFNGGEKNINFKVNTLGNSDSFFIRGSDGNVGIGKPNPTHKLHIAGSDSTLRLEGTGPLGSKGKISFGDQNFVFIQEDIDDKLQIFARLRTSIMGGNVGIFTLDPTEKLHVDGNILATGTITPGSSREYKDNIEDLGTNEALETLAALEAVTFYYKADQKRDLHIGFIAEDVPELLATPDRKGVNTMDVVGVLTKVLQEQQKTIAKLEYRIRKLEAKQD